MLTSSIITNILCPYCNNMLEIHNGIQHILCSSCNQIYTCRQGIVRYSNSNIKEGIRNYNVRITTDDAQQDVISFTTYNTDQGSFQLHSGDICSFLYQNHRFILVINNTIRKTLLVNKPDPICPKCHRLGLKPLSMVNVKSIPKDYAKDVVKFIRYRPIYRNTKILRAVLILLTIVLSMITSCSALNFVTYKASNLPYSSVLSTFIIFSIILAISVYKLINIHKEYDTRNHQWLKLLYCNHCGSTSISGERIINISEMKQFIKDKLNV